MHPGASALLVALPAFAGPSAAQAPFDPAPQPSARLAAALDGWRRAHGARWQVVPAADADHAQFLWGSRAEPAFELRDEADAVLLARLALAESAELHGLDPTTLIVDRVRFLPLALGGSSDKWTVRFVQAVDGVPVHRSAANVLLDTQGALLSVQTLGARATAHLITTPALRAAAARRGAAALFERFVGAAPTRRGPAELTIVTERRGAREVPRLAWQVDLMREEAGRRPTGLRYWLDAHDGSFLGRESLVHDFDVTGTVYTYVTPPDRADIHDAPDNQPVLVPLPYVEIRSSTHGAVHSDANGDFTFPGAGPVLDVQITYDGEFATIDSLLPGTDYEFELASLNGEGNVLTLNPAPGPQAFSTTEANAYVTIAELRDRVRFVNPGDDTADFQAVVDMNDWYVECFGGMFSQNGPRLYFPRGDDVDCYHGAFSTMVAHEMGHWLASLYGTGSGGAIGEGTADIFAMYLYDTPDWAEDYCLDASECTVASGPVRSGENGRQFCGFDQGQLDQSCHPGGIHGNGQVWMGAAWKVRRNLHTLYGDPPGAYGPGDFAADSLFFAWLNAYTQFEIHPVLEKQWLVLSDTDGDICNGTPFSDQIRDAFDEQGFPVPSLPGMCFAFGDVIFDGDEGDEIGPYLVAAPVEAPARAGVVAVTIHYSVDGGAFQQAAMSQDPTSGIWSGGIPGQLSPARVDFYLEAQDVTGATGRWPEAAPSELLRIAVGARIAVLRDDFETDLGWTVENEGLAAGAWERVDPVGTLYQPEDDFGAGTHCWLTGQAHTGDSDFDHEVKGGPARLVSPPLYLGGHLARIRFAAWFANPLGDDELVLEVREEGSSSWVRVGQVWGGDAGGWSTFDVEAELPDGDPVQLRLSVADDPDDDVLEAAVDDIEVSVLAPVGACRPAPYCVGAPSSAGPGASIGWSGSTSVAANDLVLEASGLPPGQFGLFFYGRSPIQVPFGDGFLCVGGGVFRLNPPLVTDAAGEVARPLDLTRPPAASGAGAITAFSTWRAQFWYRDPAGGGAGFNTSDGLTLPFCP